MAANRFKKLILIIFLFGIFALPFVYWLPAKIAYEIPRVLFFLRWTEVLGLTAILASPFLLKRKKVDSKLILLLVIFLLIATIASLFGNDLLKSFWGNYYRLDGLFTLYHLAILFFFVLLYWEKSWQRPLFKTISISSLIISLWTILLGFRLHILKEAFVPNWSGAIGVSFGQPNFLAGYLLVTLPFLAGLFTFEKTRKVRMLIILAIATQIAAILLTNSWAGIFGVFLFLIGWLLIQKGFRQMKFIIPLMLLISILFTSLYFFKQKQESIPNHVVAEGRGRIYKKATIAINKKPLLGYGWANFDYAFDSIDWPIKFNNDVYVDKAHSSLLEVGVTTGLIGLLVYIGILLKGTITLYKGKSKYAKYFLLSFVLYVLHSQTNVISISEEVIFWTILGVAAAKES